MNSYDLQSRLLPAPRKGGFRMDDYWTWDGSVIRGEDGLWHMFASRWPKSCPMHPGWLFLSEVVRAASDSIEGPYEFQEVVLPRRDPHRYFDGRMTHNPSIRKCDDMYLLFYIGTTYRLDYPDNPAKQPTRDDLWYHDVWLGKRIGMAWSKSVFGPWERCDRPIVPSRSGHWDAGTSSNPSPWIMPDGSIYLAYKSSVGEWRQFNIGIVRADNWQSPFRRVSESPCFQLPYPESYVEDPFLWHADGMFHMIMKDLRGDIAGEEGCGIYAWSRDAVSWTFGDPPQAYTRDLVWDDGMKEHVGQFERPQLLFDGDGRMTHIIAATAYSKGGLRDVSDAWVTVVPLNHAHGGMP